MIGAMNLLAVIIVILALAAAGGIIYAAWELSSDKPGEKSAHHRASQMTVQGKDQRNAETGDRSAGDERGP
jgi:flagellar basal body-associated protein FliL